MAPSNPSRRMLLRLCLVVTALLAFGTIVDASAQKPRGIGVTRAQLRSALGSTFVFTPGKAAAAGENLTATATDGSNAVVQIIGPEAAIIEASIMTYHETGNAAGSKRAHAHMKTFVATTAPGAADWLAKTLSSGSTTTEWKQSTTVGGVVVTLTFNPVAADRVYIVEVAAR